MLTVSGCARDPNFGLQPKAVLILAVDTSVQGKSARDDQLAQLESIATSASDDHYYFDLWSFGATPIHLWGPDQLIQTDLLQETEQDALAQAATGPRRVDRPDLLISAVAADPHFTQMQYGRIVLLTDGALSGADGPARLASAARSIASRPGWRLEALGITPQNEAVWKAALTPVMGSRCAYTSARDADNVLKQNRDE
jgi:hypothetical protein